MAQFVRSGSEFTVGLAGGGSRFRPVTAELNNGSIIVAYGRPEGSETGIVFQRISSTGVPIGGEVAVNTTVAGYQIDPKIIALTNGGFAVAWTGPDADLNGVYARLFNASGVPTTGEIRVNDLTPGNQSEVSLAALPGGGFAVLFASVPSSAASPTVIYNAFNAAGDELRPDQPLSPLTFSSGLGGNGVDSLVELPSGVQVAAWPYQGAGVGFALFTQRFGTGGVAAGASVQVDPLRTMPPGIYAPQQAITVLDNGTAVLTWREQIFDRVNVSSEIRGQLMDASGILVGTPFDIRSFGVAGTTNLPAVALPNGGFVALYTQFGTSGGGQLMARVYNPSGLADGAAFSLGTHTFGSVPIYTVDHVRTASGETVLFFSRPDGSDSNVVGAVLDRTGHAVGTPFVVNDVTTPGVDNTSSAHLLDNGSILVIWASTGTTLAAAHIEAQIIAPDGNTPTPGNDNLTGTPNGDRIDALAGNDTIRGLAGADTLVGGLGNDILDGGTNPEGSSGQGDVMLGGAGNDIYYVNSGLDLVDEGSFFPSFGFGGTDSIISTTDFYWDVASVGETVQVAESVVDPGNDGVTIVGGVFNNTLIGHSRTDVIFGRGGSDIYRAGDGIDFLSLSTLGVTDVGAYVANGVNTVIVEQRTTGANSYDIVFEFESGRDKLDVSDYGFASQAAAFAKGVNDGAGNSYFVLGDGFDYLYMVGLTLSELSANDFVV